MPFFRFAWVTQALSNHVWEAAIIPIPKNLTLEVVPDWRPISLLNVIAKLVAKILVGRLSLVLDKFINIQQAGFVKHRDTHLNILQVQLALAWAFKNCKRGYLI